MHTHMNKLMCAQKIIYQKEKKKADFKQIRGKQKNSLENANGPKLLNIQLNQYQSLKKTRKKRFLKAQNRNEVSK